MEILCVPSLWESLIWYDAFILGQTCGLAKQALNQFRPTIEQKGFLFEKAYQQRCGDLRLDLFTKAIDQEAEFVYSKPWLERIEGSCRLLRKGQCLKSIRFCIPAETEFKAEIHVGGLTVVSYYSLPGKARLLTDELFNRALPLGSEYGLEYHPVEIITSCPADVEFVKLDSVKPCHPCTSAQVWSGRSDVPVEEFCNHSQVYLITSKSHSMRSKIVMIGKGMLFPFDSR